MRRKQVGGIRGKGPRGDGDQIRNRGVWDRHQIQTGYAREIRAQTRILPAPKVEKPCDSRLAKVGIDQHGAVTQLRESHGQICRRGGLPFPRQGAGD